MPTFLQPVVTPERCFLQEVLYWVAFGRLPIAVYGDGEQELRTTEDIGGYVTEFVDNYVFEEEAERVGIPPDPSWLAVLEDRTPPSIETCDSYLRRDDLDDDFRAQIERSRVSAIAFEKELAEWQPHFERVIEYPASRIFIALREGKVVATGRSLPSQDVEEALQILSEENRDIFEIDPTPIPKEFWTLQGMDFRRSVAIGINGHYCQISVSVDDLLKIFPGERTIMGVVEKAGDSYILPEQPKAVARHTRRVGRPSYDWDRFHVEITEQIKLGALPAKKEAAIEAFRAWFQVTLGVSPSRAAIGEKLKPYYDRFIRGGGQKS